VKALPAKSLPGVGETRPDPGRRSHFAQVNGVQYQYPVCAVCKRDVVVFTWGDHFEHDGTRPMRTFFVACHGEIESVTFAQDEMRDIHTNNFRFVKAFAPKPLPATYVELKLRSQEDRNRYLAEHGVCPSCLLCGKDCQCSKGPPRLAP
jgi:hypothetical protein